MDHFYNIIAILIFSCVIHFFYFTNSIKKIIPEEELLPEEEINSGITDEELSPEKFKNFNYYIEKFS